MKNTNYLTIGKKYWTLFGFLRLKGIWMGVHVFHLSSEKANKTDVVHLSHNQVFRTEEEYILYKLKS